VTERHHVIVVTTVPSKKTVGLPLLLHSTTCFTCSIVEEERHGAEQRPPGEEGVEVAGDEVDHSTNGLGHAHGPVV
jgi:hypothetical protein